MFIYLVTNRVNNKMYIGKTSGTVEERWAQHVGNARTGVKTHLYNAIRKYEPESFLVEVVTTTEDEDSLSQLERLWIVSLRTYDQKIGYNMTFGGEGVRATEEVRAKMRAAAMGRPTSAIQKEVTSKLFKDKPKSVEQRKKMADVWTNSKRSAQSKLATEVNIRENEKLKDYICPDCGKGFIQVKRGVYGGHRKACLYWR